MLVENFSVETNELFRSECVEIAADRINRARDVLGGPGLGTLEQHMLDEMRNAVLFRRLAAGSAADPDSHRNRTDMRHGLGNHTHAIRQHGPFNVSQRAVKGAVRRSSHGCWKNAERPSFHCYTNTRMSQPLVG